MTTTVKSISGPVATTISFFKETYFWQLATLLRSPDELQCINKHLLSIKRAIIIEAYQLFRILLWLWHCAATCCTCPLQWFAPKHTLCNKQSDHLHGRPTITCESDWLSYLLCGTNDLFCVTSTCLTSNYMNYVRGAVAHRLFPTL